MMKTREHWRAALAAMGAVAGTGYASGRELTLFFAQLGWASWVGALLASALFGLLVGLLARLSGGMGAAGLPGEGRTPVGRTPVRGARRAVLLLRRTLMFLAAAVMLVGAGRVGELTLPVRNGFWWGAGIALLLAGLIRLTRLRALPALGLITLVGGMAFHGALAIDPRPVHSWLAGDAELLLEGSLPAAALLAVLYAAMNASVAAGAVLRFSEGCKSAAGLGTLCGGMLAGALLCANAALARGGRPLLAQALPMVLLSARWGLAGFWLCAGFDFLCRVVTLGAALG